MPDFKIIINIGISDSLRQYIVNTYGANIKSMASNSSQTVFIATAPTAAAFDPALADIRSRIVEIEPYNP